MYRIQKYNLSSLQEKYMLSSLRPKDMDFVSSKLKVLNQRVSYYQDLTLMLRGLYIDMDRTMCAILSPEVCLTLSKCIDETIDLFTRLIGMSASEEIADIRCLQLKLGDLVRYVKEAPETKSEEEPGLLPLIIKSCKSFNFFHDNPYYISDADSCSDSTLCEPLYYRREDTTTGWMKLTFAILPKSRELLAVSPSNHKNTKKRVLCSIDIRVFVLTNLDASYTGRPYSFQITTLKVREKQIHTFSAASRACKEKWIFVLTEMASCCFKDSLQNDLFSEDHSEKSYSQLLLSEGLISPSEWPCSRTVTNDKCDASGPSLYKSIRLTIHGLRPPQKKVTSAPVARRYCSIFIGNQKRAETSDILCHQYICEDTFEFKDICPHINTIRIVLLERRDFEASVALGHTTITLPNYPTILESNSAVLLRLIKPIQGIQVIHSEEKHWLRISYTYTVSKIIPIDGYKQFLQLLKSDSFELVRALDTVISTQYRNYFARVFLNIIFHLNCAFDCLKTLIYFDIEKTKFLNIIFRSNTILTKVLDYYFKVVGYEYLRETVGKFLDEFSPRKGQSNTNELAADITLDDPAVSAEVFEAAQRLWDIILESKTRFPLPFRLILSHIVKVVESKWGYDNDNVAGLGRYFSINSFVFLRFFCPAIMSPHLFGIRIKRCEEEESLYLKILARIMQSLANFSSSTGKNNSTIKDVGIFVDKNIESMLEFMDYISEAVTGNEPELKGDTRFFLQRDIRYEIDCAVRIFSELEPDLKGLVSNEKYLELYSAILRINTEKGELKPNFESYTD